MKTRTKTLKSDFEFKLGDGICITLLNGDTELGKIIRIITKEEKAIVKLQSGKKIKALLSQLKPDSDFPDAFAEEPDEFEAEGFTQYDIHWDNSYVNFKSKNELGIFYGWWRKISLESFAIDLYCQFQGKSYNCEVLYYTEDPRDEIDSLNADICAAINKWFYHKCRGNFETLKSLELKANKPNVRINSIETIDKILLGLRDYRDTAIKSGGLYTFMFTGDCDDDPNMRITLDLSKQAHGLQGRVPSLYTGAALDFATDQENMPRRKSKQKAERPTGKKVFQGNIDELVKRLKETKDKGQQRKLRAILRRMGHVGGSRSTK